MKNGNDNAIGQNVIASFTYMGKPILLCTLYGIYGLHKIMNYRPKRNRLFPGLDGKK